MEDKIVLSHGSGFKATRQLIEDIIKKHLNNPLLEPLGDSAFIKIPYQDLAFTTDSFVVSPLFFRGSDIGKLSVYGTVNDLAVSGAKPLYLSLGFIIEEGLSLRDFERIIISIKEAKDFCGVEVACGDLKVVPQGKADKIFINTSGIGQVKKRVSLKDIRPADALIVNGFLGDHEIAVLLSREEFGIQAEVSSDCAPLWRAIERILKECQGVRFMRDLTRGGLGVCLNELVAPDWGFILEEEHLPVREEVRSICELLGFDFLYLANEGKFLLIISSQEKEKALRLLKEEGFKESACIGQVSSQYPGKVVLKTSIGGKRLVDYPHTGQLPRIC